ncbi:MAG: cupin domain-containing protein [Victivallaceae bacterium]|nr:cupin domain-containing protein [Victivallaceae bacterium]
MQAQEIIASLRLQPLAVEGGFFRELYRSGIVLKDRRRCCGTSIYYLLQAGAVSAWHKVAGDEIWYYHSGSPAVQLLIHPDGTPEKRIIGADIRRGQLPQSVIPAGTWQAAVLLEPGKDSWGLFGAAVFPGFEYADFTSTTVEQMTAAFPHLAEILADFFPNNRITGTNS